jgi:soluble lytic murein transglycosylase-like protein
LLPLVIASGCGNMHASHLELHGIDITRGGWQGGTSNRETQPVVDHEDNRSILENRIARTPVELEPQPCPWSMWAPMPALLEESCKIALTADYLRSGAPKGTLFPAEPLMHLSARTSAHGINREPRSAPKPAARQAGAKRSAANDEALLKKIMEALSDTGATKESLEIMLSEWGESTIGVDDALVQHVIYFLKCFAFCQRESTSATLQRSEKYLPRVRRAFSKYRLPEELAFAVPFVESRFTETAMSEKGALGMFQFLASTAMDYGVTVSAEPSEDGMPGVDERLDWNKTSVAAARFLSDHRKKFNSVLLALQSYHDGASAVAEVLTALAMEDKAGPFNSVFTCPKLEAYSREYIPLCLAAAYLYRMMRETDAIRIPVMEIQYVSLKKPASLDMLSARHDELTTKNPDLTLAVRLYCYASTGGYLLITELNNPGLDHAGSHSKPFLTSKR